MQLLASATKDTKNILATIVGLLASITPSSAYRVRGTLLKRDGPQACGLAVQVVTAPRYTSPPEFFWARTWNEAVEAGAHSVAAYLLPRTTQSRRPPWTGWRGVQTPPRLLQAHTEATEAAANREYDIALDGYFAALHADPLNLHLRLEVGQLQEKLALWLDALVTYDELIQVAERTAHRPGLRPRHWVTWREHKRTELIARYRRAVLLGFAERLAQQWCKYSPESPRRHEERQVLRERLRSPLRERYAAALDRQDQAAQTTVKQLLSGPLARKPRLRDEISLRQFFALASEQELRDVHRRVKGPRVLTNRSGLTRTGVNVAIAWAGLRQEWSRHLLAAQSAPPNQAKDSTERDWIEPEKLEQQLQKLLKPRPWRQWQDHYNGACAYSVLLLQDPRTRKRILGGKMERDKFATLAVEQLERGAPLLDSATLGRRRAWVLSEDPDLAGLRGEPAFTRFEATHFPSRAPVQPRPAKVHAIELARYTSKLLRRCARQFDDEWHIREDLVEHKPDLDVMQRWLKEEIEAIAAVKRIAADHQHWQTRVDVLKRMRAWCASNDRDALRVPYPKYSQDPLEAERKQLDNRGASHLLELDGRLDTLREDTTLDDHSADCEACRQKFMQLDLDGIKASPIALAALCSRRAGFWGWLAEWMRQPPHAPPPEHTPRTLAEVLAERDMDFDRWAVERTQTE